MSEPSLNDETPIDLQSLLVSRLLIQANSGGGKSYALRRVIEQTAPHVQQFIIDPEGEFASLREKFDYVICAAEGGDALAHPGTAKALAHKLLEAGVSAVFDIYELEPEERTLFVSRFCRAMVEAPKALWHPCMVIIDEAQDFAPERGSKKRAKEIDATGAIIALSAKGRKRGYMVGCATQRLSRLNKDVAAELQNKLIGLAGLPIDVAANGFEVGMNARQAQAIFPTMDPGEFYAFGPAISRSPIRIKVGPVETSHPEAGQLGHVAPPAPSERLREILSGLSDLPEAHEDDPEALRARIAELEQQMRGRTFEVVPANNSAELAQLRERVQVLERVVRGGVQRINEQRKTLLDVQQIAAQMQACTALEIGPEARLPDVMTEPVLRNGASNEAAKSNAPPAPVAKRPIRQAGGETSSNGAGANLTKAEFAMLRAFWWLKDEDVTPAKVSFYSGYALSGYTDKLLGKLRVAGLLNGWRITPSGEAAIAGKVESKPTGDELREWLRPKLKAAENRMLDVLIEARGKRLSDDEISERTGFARSGYYDKLIGHLRSLEVAEGYAKDGGAKAAEVFFS